MKKKISRKQILFIVIVITFVVLYLLFGEKFNLYIPCPIHEITGLYCPGCGITRMFLSMLQLDFYQAFRYNPFVFMLVPFFIVYYLEIFISRVKGKKSFMENKIPNYFWYILIVLMIIYFVARNIKIFNYLGPTVI